MIVKSFYKYEDEKLFFWRDNNSRKDASLGLVSLTPEYIEQEHGGYVREISNALDNPKIRNIALSGNYGVGKSSILQKVAELQKENVVELSLSTLAPYDEDGLDNSVPKQATTTTNRIQQEIVKQLLYRAEPNKTPGSRFRRIERFNLFRELVISCCVSFVITTIFLLTEWTDRIIIEFEILKGWGTWIHLLILALMFSLTLLVRFFLQGRIHIRELSAGSASVTLDDNSMSYFDQYLDEIVYFFEVSKRNIVIFEDIDRFNDSHIFETLRSLNVLLNFSPQITKPICFIYAIKDSIFDCIGLKLEGRKVENNVISIEDPALAEVVRANRTKFFDLIIPVVPFITHRSARNITTQLLSGIDHKVSSELIDIASKYVPDMRLLKNVCNEFLIFRDRVLSGEGRHLNLNDTDLFAMMLYKSTHLTDFEAIRIGKSKLDFLYDTGRKLVVTNVQRIQSEQRSIRNRIANIDGLSSRSTQIGEQFINYVGRAVRAANFNNHNIQYQFKNRIITEEDLRKQEFWVEFLNATEDLAITWHNRYQGQILKFIRSDFVDTLSENLNPIKWDELDRVKFNETSTENLDNLKFLRRCDMGDLIKRTDFLVHQDGSNSSFDSIVRKQLTEGLAFHLVRSGYINRNFTLYTSTFHGDRVSSAATNFIIHHIERDTMDEHFKLEGDDIEAILRECGEDIISEAACYNIDILNYLLVSNVSRAETVIRSMIRNGIEQKRFSQAYLNSEDVPSKFFEIFTKLTPNSFICLIKDIEIDELKRRHFIDCCMSNLSSSVEYSVDPQISEYLKNNLAGLSCLRSNSINEPSAGLVGKIFKMAAVKVNELQPLSDFIKNVFITHNLYLINRGNLEVVFGVGQSLSLSVALQINRGLYNYCINNLAEYLTAIHEASATADSEASFGNIIEDVLVSAPERINDFIKLSSNACVVRDLNDVSDEAWPHLAQYGRFGPTFNNVSSYIQSSGSIDAYLANLLISAEEISDHQEADESKKQELAIAILSESQHISSTFIRTQLADSLELRDYIDASHIPAEEGELFSLLLRLNIIEDNIESYTHLSEMSWKTRELVTECSTRFIEYMSPDLVAGNLNALLLSDKVDQEIKLKIANNADEYIHRLTRNDIYFLGNFVIQHRLPVSFEVIQAFASNGMNTRNIVILLEPHLKSLAKELLIGLLKKLDGDYPRLAFVGRDQPKIPCTNENLALLDKLKQHGIVSSYEIDTDIIKVNKRHKQ